MNDEIRNFNKSVRHAFSGLRYVARYERNFQIELVIAFFVVVMMMAFQVKSWEAIVLILMMLGVLVAELTNTVVERVVDILKPRVHPYARLIKDIMAAVVLLSSMVSVIVGVIIFLPYFEKMFDYLLR